MNITTLNKTQRIDGEWNGEKFWFECKTNALTPKFLASFTSLQTDPMELAAALADVITAWDLDADGEPFPPTKDNFASMPVDFLAYMIERMSEIWAGEKKSLKASASI